MGKKREHRTQYDSLYDQRCSQVIADEDISRLIRSRSSDKPYEKASRVRKSHVLYEGDVDGVRRKLRPSNIVTALAYLCCIAVIVYAGAQLAEYLKETLGAENEYQDVQQEYIEPADDSDSDDVDLSSLPPLIDFASLQADNPDVAGWIRIPGTTVDYPIMTSADKDYYLHRDMHGDYSYSGSIFADYQNTNDLSQGHWVIYGHHMITPTMFHDVSRYLDKDYFDTHRTIYIETPSKTYVLKAVGLHVVQPEEYEARQVLFKDEESFQSYFDSRIDACDSIYYDDWDRSTSDRLVTLVTCANSGKAREIVECTVEQEYPTSMVQNVIDAAKKNADSGDN